MRGEARQQSELFSYIPLEMRIPRHHPLRPMRELAEEVLTRMDKDFERIYSHTGSPSIAPEALLKATFLVWKESGKIIFGFDNHKPKGPHVHYGKHEKSYDFKDVDTLIKDFWKHVYEEGFLI